jgi:hypothetical protein
MKIRHLALAFALLSVAVPALFDPSGGASIVAPAQAAAKLGDLSKFRVIVADTAAPGDVLGRSRTFPKAARRFRMACRRQGDRRRSLGLARGQARRRILQ